MRAVRTIMMAAAFAMLSPTPVLAQMRQVWTRSWQAVPVEISSSRLGLPPPGAAPASAPAPVSQDATFRTVLRLSAGGSTIRLRLSNELSSEALKIGAVHVALAGPTGAPLAGSDRTVTFAGAAAPTIPAGAPLVSDPVALNVAPLARLVVSIHVPGELHNLTVHSLGVARTARVPGDQTAAAVLTPGTSDTRRYLISGIDVAGGPAKATIVTFGDSITDGAVSTDDADRRWPDVLAERLKASGRNGFAVANAGISGNRLLSPGAGQAALARLDRDVLSVPGVKYLVLLEGVNDLGFATMTKGARLPAADELIAAYRQIVARAHDHGVKVIGATVLPYKGAGYYAPEGDTVR
jgi:lysophospholipase L1-like esterase